MKYLISILLGLIMTPYLAFAKPGGESEEESGSGNGSVALRIKSISFVEDNEFFNPIVEGYTLLGFFFQPEIIYTPASRISLSGGIHVMKYHGLDKFSQVRPVFSTTLRFTDKTSLTLGTLSGPDKHQLFDPHFYDERLYNKYVEDGIQLIHSGKHIFNDVWVSWENFIMKGDSARESLTSGESFRYTSSPLADFITLEVPVQFEVKHLGGQISDYNAKTQSFFSGAGGVVLTFDINGKRSGQAGIGYLHFVNWMRAGDQVDGMDHGKGSLYRTFYSYKIARLEVDYWHAHDFFAPNGNPIYGCVSTVKPGNSVHYRDLVIAHGSLRFFPAAPVEFFFGVDLYYDPSQGRTDQAYTLHLNFDKLISLTSKKHNS
jgi:hypothetical protein